MPEGQYSAAAGREVRLGIRPENLKLAGDDNGHADLTTQVVEQLGADTLIHGHFGNDRTNLIVRMQGTISLKQGEVLALRVTAEHLHLFDPHSGQRI